MKRIIALALVLMITSCLPVFALAADEVSYTPTFVFADWNFETSGVGKSSAGEYDFGGEHGMVMVPPSGADVTISNSLSNYKGTFAFEADYYFSNLPASTASLLYFRPGTPQTFLNINSVGAITPFGLSSPVIATVAEDTWFHVYLEFTFDDRIINVTITDADGVSNTVNEIPIPESNTTYATLAKFNIAGAEGVYVDNVKLTHMARNFLMSAEGIDADGNGLGADGVIYDGGKIKVTFTEPMDSETLLATNFTLTNQFGRSIPFTGAYDSTANVFTITPSEKLAPHSEYAISAVNLKTKLGGLADSDEAIAVKTIGAPFSITAVSDGVVSSGSVTYTVSVQNEEYNAETGLPSGYVVAVSYDGDKMNSVGMTLVSVGDDYEVTLASGGDRTVFYLMASDGTFKLLDIFSE